MRYKLVTPSGRVRHWILVDGPDFTVHGPNDYTSDGFITRTTAATMLRAWRRMVAKEPRRYSITRKAD